MDQVASLRLKLTQKDAVISSLERTSQLQNEAVMALRQEVAKLKKQLAEKDRVVSKLEDNVRNLNDVLQERDVMVRAIKSELDHKAMHVLELANELRAVEEEMISRHCGGGIDTFEEASMPSLAIDSLSIERRRKKKQSGSDMFEQ